MILRFRGYMCQPARKITAARLKPWPGKKGSPRNWTPPPPGLKPSIDRLSVLTCLKTRFPGLKRLRKNYQSGRSGASSPQRALARTTIIKTNRPSESA